MFLALLFGLIGLLFRGTTGLLWGALIGYLLGQFFRMALRRGLQAVQQQFLDSTFAVMGAVCKVDGVVTPDEIRAAEDMFVRLRLTKEQKESAKAAFSRGKAPDFDLDGEVDRFAAKARGSVTLFHLFLQVQLTAVAADGEVHPKEREMLLRIARRLGLAERDVAQLEAFLRTAAHRASTAGGPPPRQNVEDAYAVLGVSPQDSDADIKRAYRKLIAENHPDRLASKGMPESMRELAEERARNINAAYDVIKRTRPIA